MVAKNTLLHRESLFIVSSSNATSSTKPNQLIPENVTLEFITQGVTLHFLRHSLVHEHTATHHSLFDTLYSLFSSSMSIGF